MLQHLQMMKLYICLLLLSTIITHFNSVIHCANILAFLPSPGQSHSKPLYPLLRELAHRDHNITLFSYFPLEGKIDNIHNVVIKADIPLCSIGFGNLRMQSQLFNWIYLHDEVIKFITRLIEEEIFKEFITTNTKYDLIFIEMYHTDGLFALGQLYNCPIIGVSFQPIIPSYNWVFGKSLSSSYIPHGYLPFTDVMNFWQRTINFLLDIFTVLFYNFKSVPQFNKQINLILKNRVEHVPTVQDLTRNISLILVESHFSTAHVKPELTQMINVAGIHIEKTKPLPIEIETFMESATDGVIFVSLGSLIEPTAVEELGFRLLRIFEKLPQKVIWKWNADYFENIPSNVLIRGWLPQMDILNHPKCKLFISHGGYHSLIEGIYSGVPILGLPFMTDQQFNTAIINKLRIGIKISPDASEEDLENAVEELLNNATYKKQAEAQSVLFKDRPSTAMNTAIYWTEYVLRHKKTDHLRTAAPDLYGYQYLLLDVILFISLCFLIPIYILISCLRKMGQTVREKSIKQVKEKNN